MRYFKREWDETRGDSFDHWGTSTWYLEVAPDTYPARQIQVYARGPILKYDPESLSDEYGALGDQPIDLDDFAPFEISASAFEAAWSRFQRTLETG